MITNDRQKVRTTTENSVGEEWEDANTTGWNVEIWGNSALKVRDHLEIGDPIIVLGVIFEDKWVDKTTGEEKSSLLVKAEAIGLDVGKVK
jgi:single-strand DNA-binding protein